MISALRSNIILALALISLSSALPTLEREDSLSYERASEGVDSLVTRKFNPANFVPDLIPELIGNVLGGGKSAQPAQPITTMIQQPMDRLMIPRSELFSSSDVAPDGNEPIKDVSGSHHRRELSVDEIDVLLRREPFSGHNAIEDDPGVTGSFHDGALVERKIGVDEPDIFLPRDPKFSLSHAIEHGLKDVGTLLEVGGALVKRDMSEEEEMRNLMARSLWGKIAKDGLKVGKEVVEDVLPNVLGSNNNNLSQRDVDEEVNNLLVRSFWSTILKDGVKVGEKVLGSGNSSFFRRDEGAEDLETLLARSFWDKVAKKGLDVGKKVVGNVLPSVLGSGYSILSGRDVDEEMNDLLVRSLWGTILKDGVKVGEKVFGSGNSSFFRRDDGLDEADTLQAREHWEISDATKMPLSDQD